MNRMSIFDPKVNFYLLFCAHHFRLACSDNLAEDVQVNEAFLEGITILPFLV